MKNNDKLLFLKNLDDEYIWLNSPPDTGPYLEIEIATSSGVISNNSMWSGCGIEGPISIDEEQHAAITKAISEGSTDDFDEDEVLLVEAGGKPNATYFMWSSEYFPELSGELFEGWEKASEEYALEVSQHVEPTPWDCLDADDVSEWFDRVIKVQAGKQPW
jgi:hypothetical protein